MIESYILGYLRELIPSFLLQNSFCVLVFLVVLLSSRYFLGSNINLPPGPWGIPVLGYLPFINKDIHVFMLELSQKFGSIYRLSFGSKMLIVLTDPKIIREAFRREEFTARPSNALYDIFDGYGLINIEGDIWRNQRRFMHEGLRYLGVKLSGPGRNCMEERIRVEVISLLRGLSARKNKMTAVDDLFTNASINVICMLLMSIRFQPDCPKFLRFMELNKEGFRLFLKCDIANYIPALKYAPSVNKNFQKLTRSRDETLDMIRDIIKQRREIFDPEIVRDILDSYLLEEHNAKREGRVLYEGKEFDRQLMQVVTDMISAGEETVKTCLLWSLVFLINSPEVMHKIQDELDAVVGRSRMPSLDDRPHLPYTEATICEVLRRSSAAPLGTSHAATKDTVLGGYNIPKGTTIIPLLYSCHMNPNLWEEPEKFDPTRFLDEEGRVKIPETFMPFGVGRRMCLGQALARSEMFLFFTSILQNFTLGCPEDEPLPSMKGMLGVTYVPKPFKLMFIPREGSKFGDIERESYEYRTMGL